MGWHSGGKRKLIDFNLLKSEYEKATGYTLYMDFGELDAAYREKNTIVFPVCGVYSINPMILTAIPSPFVGVATADITIVSIPEQAEEVRKILNEAAETLNGTSIIISDVDGRNYNITYNTQTSTFGNEANVSWYHGRVVLTRQTITYTIIENGISSYEDKLEIDGHFVPVLSLTETKVYTSSVYPDARSVAKTVNEQEGHGIDFTMPRLNDELSNELYNLLATGKGSKIHCVKHTSGGAINYYMMIVSSITQSVQPPQNIGFNVSLTEGFEEVAAYDDLWEFETVTGNVAHAPLKTSNSVYFWGDGTAEFKPVKYHVYTDGEEKHIISKYLIVDDPYFKNLRNKNIYGVNIRYTWIEKDRVYASDIGEGQILILTDTGDKLEVSGGRIVQTTSTGIYAIDKFDSIKKAYYIKNGDIFTSVLSGIVINIDTSHGIFSYNRKDVVKDYG